MDAIGWKYYIVYVVWLAIETSTIYFVYPETKMESLEEVAIVMEGEKAAVEVIEVEPHDKTSLRAEHVEKV